jgi:transketolase
MGTHQFSSEQKQLRRRLLELIYTQNLSHLGSCLSAIDIVDAVYTVKRPEEKFILSNGHAGLALYTVLEKFGLLKKDACRALHLHPDRSAENNIDLSTGSLGQGLPIALGMALADRSRNVYCLISDGESAEGSIWEALRIGAELKVGNLRVIVNANGWAAYMPVDIEALHKRIASFGYEVIAVDGHSSSELVAALQKSPKRPQAILAKTDVEQFSFLKGLDAHYHVMSAEEYAQAKEVLA